MKGPKSKKQRPAEPKKEEKTMFDSINNRVGKTKRESRSLRGMAVTELRQYYKEREQRRAELQASKLKYEVALQRNLRADPTTAQILTKKLDAVSIDSAHVNFS